MKQISLFLFLSLAPIARAQTVGEIRLDFPPMPIHRVGIGLMQAALEPFSGTVTLDNGTVLNVSGSIPATYVRGHGTFYTVDACVGTAEVDHQGTMVIDLPPEPVRLRHGVMTALAITSKVTVTLPDGQVGTGTIFFPDCPTSFQGPGHYLASAVVATGTVTFP